MTVKVLLWADAGLTEFIISKYLNEKLEADIYAIYDVNHHLKQSFTSQKIVNFKKCWFYWDNYYKILEPADLDYLSNFESKYNIDLWQLAYSERIFYKFNPFHQFTKNEILSILSIDCKFFEKILDDIKPDFLIIKAPDMLRHELLWKLCNSKGIKILTSYTGRIGNRTIISQNFDSFDSKFIFNSDKLSSVSFIELQNYLQKFNKTKQMKKSRSGGVGFSFTQKIKIFFDWMTKTLDEKYKKTYDHYGITIFTVLKTSLKNEFNRWYRNKILSNLSQTQIPDEQFIYFPLQVEPERNVSFGAPYFSNQFEVISHLAKSLPVNYKLYVKEHFSMKLRSWRSIEFYKKILNLPNVRLIHPDVSQNELLSKCSLVCAITGSTGFEASVYGKPSLVFANVSYSELSCVFKIYDLDNIPNLIQHALQFKVNPIEIKQYIEFIIQNSIEFDAVSFHEKIMTEFHRGPIFDDKIDMEKLLKFLNDNQESLEILSQAYADKILELYKN